MATARKTAVKKVVPATSGDKQIVITRTDWVDVNELHLYHKNPNVGDIDEIAVSLHQNGQFKPIVVNIGTHTGRPNEILAGNHTYLATRKEVRYDGPGGKMLTKPAWSKIYASFVDVDDPTAVKIVLADNETAAKAHRQERIVAELLASLPEVDRVGTGFNPQETEDLLSRAAKDAEEALANMDKVRAEQEQIDNDIARRKTFAGAPLGEEPEGSEEDDDDDTPAGPSLEKASDELEGAYELKEELADTPLNRVGYWGIPRIRPDMLMTPDEVPDNLEAWAGSATKDWPDADQWWLYNWGIDSTSGMRDVSKVVISFYTWDEYFENWFWYPKKYVTKCLNSGIKYILTPNFSMWPTQSQTLNLWALYRARYVGRYCQDAGLKLIPDIGWPMGDLDFLKKHILATLPKKVPLISMQLQTWDEKEVEAQKDNMIEGFRLVMDTLNPDGILLYAGKPGYDWFIKNVKFSGKIFLVSPRVAKLAEAQKKRVKKTGI